MPDYQQHERFGVHYLRPTSDDFVVVSNASQAEVKATKQAIQRFLENELHLTLSEEKTVITHVNDGFDFLGFHIQRKRGQRQVGGASPTDGQG